MRIIQFLVDCPYPPISGADIRNIMIGRGAAHLGAFLCVGLTPGVNQVPRVNQPELKYKHLEGFANRNPWHAFDPQHPTEILFNSASTQEIRKLLEDFSPDLVIVEGVALTAILDLAREFDIPTVLDMHNIESKLFAESQQQLPFRKRIRDIFSPTSKLSVAQKTDREGSRLADVTWVCSETDQQLLHELNGEESCVLPNPIPDVSLLDIPIMLERYRNPTSLFVGHLSYFPNVAAVKELAKRMATSRLSVKLVVAGRSPGRSIRNLAKKNEKLCLIADPSSTQDLLSDHGYTLLPIRYGSGTRIKVVEAMAAGVVVIGTSRAVEGLGLTGGLHYFLCETAREMWEKLQQFVHDPQAAAQVALQARKYVEDTFHPLRLEKQVGESLTACRATRSQPASK